MEKQYFLACILSSYFKLQSRTGTRTYFTFVSQNSTLHPPFSGLFLYQKIRTDFFLSFFTVQGKLCLTALPLLRCKKCTYDNSCHEILHLILKSPVKYLTQDCYETKLESKYYCKIRITDQNLHFRRCEL